MQDDEFKVRRAAQLGLELAAELRKIAKIVGLDDNSNADIADTVQKLVNYKFEPL